MGKRRPTGHLTGGLTDQDTEGGKGAIGSRHPIAQQIREEFPLDTPGVAHGLTRLQVMQAKGEEITTEIARACIQTYVDYHSRLIREEQEKAARSVVYYMRLGPLVKIGWTTNLEGRREAINPQEVMATEPGGRDVERKRHQEFAALRVHGEWFTLESPLMEWVASLKPAERKSGDGMHMISTKDATRLFGTPYSRLRLWADEGRLCAPERRGRELFWNAEEVEQMRALLGDRKRLPVVKVAPGGVTQL